MAKASHERQRLFVILSISKVKKGMYMEASEHRRQKKGENV